MVPNRINGVYLAFTKLLYAWIDSPYKITFLNLKYFSIENQKNRTRTKKLENISFF